MTEILKDLNEEQRRAVTCVSGPMLIVAGAGSGKTRVLTSRIAYMIDQGVPPERILALTFTKKAAGEMKDRIALMVGARRARSIWMGTFHSIFVRFLREYADSIGFPYEFTIYDTTDSVSAIKHVMKQMLENKMLTQEEVDKVYKPKEVLSRISKAKNSLVTPTPYMNGTQNTFRKEDGIHNKPKIFMIYSEYCRYCKNNGAMDFDDILLYMNILLRENAEALESISSRFDHVLVDEYQDTNYAQYVIIRKIRAKNQNICVVGDDSQSIYGFRGAEIQNILNFNRDFPKAELIKLERNYRSTQVIVNAANTIIAKNDGRIPKNCVSMGEVGEKIHYVHAYSDVNEADTVATSILSRIRVDRCQYKDFAVLYRTNAQGRIIEEKLRAWNVPYILYGPSFYDRLEVKDFLSYLKLITNLKDNESLKRIVNKPLRGIGETTVNNWERIAANRGLSMFETIFQDNLESEGLRNASILKIREFCSMIQKYALMVPTSSAFEIADGVLRETGLASAYDKESTLSEKNDRAHNLEEVLNAIAQRQQEIIEEKISSAEDGVNVEVPASIINGSKPVLTLPDYLEDVMLLSSVDEKEEDSGSNKVTVMTMHMAKGLEFMHVFVCGMEENIFPSGGWTMTAKDLEEERRLCYVAMTRAKKTLTMLFATKRFRNGKDEYNPPSRFLREIAPQYVDKPLLRDDMGIAAYDGDFSDERKSFLQRPSSFKPSFSGTTKPSFSGTTRPSFTGTKPSFSGTPTPSSSGLSRGSQPTSAPKPAYPAPKPSFAPRPDIIDANFVPDPMSSFKVGDRIEHNRFGAGKVLEITGQIPELKAKIHFDQYGDKLLLLKFAKLRHI